MMHTTTSPVVQVLTRSRPTSATTFTNTQLTAAVSAHPLAPVARPRLCAALRRQAVPSALGGRVHLWSPLLQRSTGWGRPLGFRCLGQTVEPVERGSSRVGQRLRVSADRGTSAFRTWRLVAVRQGIRLWNNNILLLAPLWLGNDDADDDAEENHEPGGAADDGAQLLVVDHPQLARVEWGLDFVATAAL